MIKKIFPKLKRIETWEKIVKYLTPAIPKTQPVPIRATKTSKTPKQKIWLSLLFIAITAFLFTACSSAPDTPSDPFGGKQLLGSYVMTIDTTTHKVYFENRTKERLEELGISARLDSSDSVYESGLIGPANCGDPGYDWNSVTNILSVNTKIYNRTDSLPSDQQKIILTPIELRLTGQNPSNSTGLIKAVNTELPGAGCGDPGIRLENDDADGNGLIDCIWPDDDTNTEDDPGWDFSSRVGDDNRLTPGEESDCSLIIQFTLDHEQNFQFYYDLLGVVQTSYTPDPPSVDPVTSPTNIDHQVISGTCDTAGTVYIDRGLDPTTREPAVLSQVCSSGTYAIDVGLYTDTTNNLEVYQVVTGERSGSSWAEIIQDSTAPEVTGSSPADQQQNVSIYTNIIVNFNEAMDPSTFVDRSTVFLDQIGSCGSSTFTGDITVSSNGLQLIFDPDTNLNDGCEYRFRIYGSDQSSNVKDLAGNALSTTYDITFETAASTADTTPPTIVSIFPTDNAADIARNTFLSVTFSEPMDTDTFSMTDCNEKGSIPNIALVNEFNDGLVGFTLRWNGDATRVDLIPDTDMNADNFYSFIISSCITDLAGNALSRTGKVNSSSYDGTQSYHFYSVFNTSPDADTTKPELTAVIPVNGASGAMQGILARMIFSEPIDSTTIIDDNMYMTIQGDPAKIPLSLEQGVSGQTVAFKPTSSLNTNTTYAMTATINVADYSGNGMNTPQTSQFTTATSADTTAPSVLKITPADGSTGVSPYTEITVWFSEPLEPFSVNSSSVVFDSGGTALVTSLKLSYNDQKLVITPGAYPLSAGTTYYVRLNPAGATSLIKDKAGNTLPSTTYSFVVGSDTTAPSVVAVWPPDGSTNVSPNSIYVAFFDEPLDPDYIKVEDPAGEESPNQFVAQYKLWWWWLADWAFPFVSSDRKMVVINVFSDYYHDYDYRFTWKRNGVRDRSGNRLVSDYTTYIHTGSTKDLTPPNVTSSNPVDGEINTPVDTTIQINFNEAMDPRTITEDSLFIHDSKGNIVPAEWEISHDLRTITITPIADLDAAEDYRIIVTTALRDASGNRLDGQFSACFSTDSTPCE